jgi:hypothetical protein
MMRFKNPKQQAAVMAKLRAKGITMPQARNMTYTQLRQRGVHLVVTRDADGYGVRNVDDCKPLNPKEQGWIHDAITGVGRGIGYVGAEVVSGVRDVPKGMKNTYKKTLKKEAAKMKAEEAAIEAYDPSVAAATEATVPTRPKEQNFFQRAKQKALDYKEELVERRKEAEKRKLEDARDRLAKLRAHEEADLAVAQEINRERAELAAIQKERRDIQEELDKHTIAGKLKRGAARIGRQAVHDAKAVGSFIEPTLHGVKVQPVRKPRRKKRKAKRRSESTAIVDLG